MSSIVVPIGKNLIAENCLIPFGYHVCIPDLVDRNRKAVQTLPIFPSKLKPIVSKVQCFFMHLSSIQHFSTSTSSTDNSSVG